MSKSDSFTCEYCCETFTKGWSDEEADKEYAEVFPEANDDKAVVCDDCYKLMITTMPPQKGVNYE